MVRTLANNRPHILLSLVLILTFLAFWPGLSGGFVFDDGNSLLYNENIALSEISTENLIAAAQSDNAGPTGRPISMLSFALNHYYAAGFDPWHFKLTNLVIHLLNGIAIYLFLTLVLGKLARRTKPGPGDITPAFLALAVATAWLLHPLAFTSVLYVVQRMNSLATLFILIGLIVYVQGRNRLDKGETGKGFALIFTGIIGFGLLAVFSKENGALLPLYALVTETALFRFQSDKPAHRKILIGFFAITVLIPALGFLVFVILKPEWLLATYEFRSFTLTERLLTESRILWQYLKWIIMPANTELGLFHDDITVSTGLLTPISTLTSIAGLLLLLAASFVARYRAPLATFGILWFLAGHSLESTILPLELAHEHRNYLPMLGILLAVFSYLLTAARSKPALRLTTGVALAVILLFGISTTLRASQWRNNISFYLSDVEHHPNSERSNYHAGRQYLILYQEGGHNQEHFDKAMHYFKRAAALDKTASEGLFGIVLLNYAANKKTEPEVITDLAHRLESGIVGPFEAGSMKELAGYTMLHPPILPKKDLLLLFDSILSNKLLGPEGRGMFFAILGTYYSNWLHSQQDAFMLAVKAIEVAPEEALFNVNLANFFVSVGEYAAAHEQIEIARKKDRSRRRSKEIASVESKVLENLHKKDVGQWRKDVKKGS